jgi:Cupin domain
MNPPHRVLPRSEETDGRIALIESTMPAGAAGPPLHTHTFDETFYVLEGELTFQVGNEVRVARAGEVAFAVAGCRTRSLIKAPTRRASWSSARLRASSASSGDARRPSPASTHPCGRCNRFPRSRSLVRELVRIQPGRPRQSEEAGMTVPSDERTPGRDGTRSDGPGPRSQGRRDHRQLARDRRGDLSSARLQITSGTWSRPRRRRRQQHRG